MISRFKDQLADDKGVHLAWCAMRDQQLISAISQQAFEAVLLDCQHGFHNEGTVLDCIPNVVNAGKSPIVRIPIGRWDLCERVLDFGALGVVAPMINNVDDARAFAKSAKYLNPGARSYSPRYAAQLYGISGDEYMKCANDCTFSFAQIETREAYDNLDEILAVDGIDGVLMGPSDFSISITQNRIPDNYGSGTIDLIRDIAERTRKAGKHAAAFTANTDHANLVYACGYRLISLAMDSTIIAAGSAAAFKNLDF
ncbi:MAG: aldolase/citrate lyase family protein [Pseudomonadota bacterium]